MSESHTSTNQWQSFELRMRHRRAERCLLRAAAALDADVPEVAWQLLEEARALAPEHPDLREVTGRLLRAGPAAAADDPQSPRGVMYLLLYTLLALALVWGASSTESASLETLTKYLLITVRCWATG